MTGNQDLNVQSDPDTLCFFGTPYKEYRDQDPSLLYYGYL